MKRFLSATELAFQKSGLSTIEKYIFYNNTLGYESIMHILDPTYQQNMYIFDDNEDGMSVMYGSSYYDDILGSEQQYLDSSSARQYMQEQFRIVAENLQDA